jgi:Na+-driven multidrug efflux pump
MYFLRNQVLALYLGDSAEAIYFGATRMSYVARFYAIGACYGIFSAALQAFGYSIIPMINSILTVFVFRIIWLEFIYPVLDAVEHTIANVYVCFTFSWVLTLLAHFSVFLFVYLRYLKTGKVKRM